MSTKPPGGPNYYQPQIIPNSSSPVQTHRLTSPTQKRSPHFTRRKAICATQGGIQPSLHTMTRSGYTRTTPACTTPVAPHIFTPSITIRPSVITAAP